MNAKLQSANERDVSLTGKYVSYLGKHHFSPFHRRYDSIKQVVKSFHKPFCWVYDSFFVSLWRVYDESDGEKKISILSFMLRSRMSPDELYGGW